MATVSPRLEDYLEALFLLETAGSKQTVTALAENLKLTKGTIATVIKKMTEQQLVLHESYGNIRLTEKGRKIGWDISMKHERLTSFFHDFLEQDAARSEEIACLIEHHLDGAAANRFFNLISFLQKAQLQKETWTKELFSFLETDVLPPMPLMACSTFAFSVTMALCSSCTDMEERIRRAVFTPMPFTVISMRKNERSSSSKKPKS